jgi:hypothetical protein
MKATSQIWTNGVYGDIDVELLGWLANLAVTQVRLLLFAHRA